MAELIDLESLYSLRGIAGPAAGPKSVMLGARRGTTGQLGRVYRGEEDGMGYGPASDPTMDAIRQWAVDNPLDAGALALAPVPIVGDVAGFANDMRHYAADPESRTMLNYGMTAAGLLPFVPSAFGMVKNVGKGPEIGYNSPSKTGVLDGYHGDGAARPGSGVGAGTETAGRDIAQPGAGGVPGSGDAGSGGGVLTDSYGRVLDAPLIAGSRVPGGPKIGLTREEIESIIQQLGWRKEPAKIVPTKEMPRRDAIGTYNPRTQEIHVRDNLGPAGTLDALGHELGHKVDDTMRRTFAEISADFPKAGKSHREAIEMAVSNGLSLAQAKKADELFAQNLGTYLHSPDLFHRKAPNLALWYQKNLNDHPELKKLFQVNEMAAALAAAGVGAGALSAFAPSDAEAAQ